MTRRQPGATGGWQGRGLAGDELHPAFGEQGVVTPAAPTRPSPTQESSAPGPSLRPFAIGVLLGVVLGLLIGLILVGAAPRPAATAIPAGAPRSGTPGPSGNLSQPTGAPRYAGTATWYCAATSACTVGHRPGDLVAAIDTALGFGRGDRLTVRAFGRSVTVTVVDVCACAGDRLIDLTRAAFARLADPGLGVIPVTVELAAPGPPPTAPRTDVAP